MFTKLGKEIEQRGIKKGIEKGRKEGIEKAIQTLKRLLKQGYITKKKYYEEIKKLKK